MTTTTSRTSLLLAVLLCLTTAAAKGADVDAAVDVMGALDRCLDRGPAIAVAESACELVAARASHLDQSQLAALLHRRGQIELARGRHGPAVALLEQARALEPMVAPYYLTLGDALLAGGQIPRAIEVYQQGRALAPTSKVFPARLDALARTAAATQR